MRVKFKAVTAKTNYGREAQKALDTALHQTGRLVKQDFESTVTTWVERPVFFVTVEPGGVIAGTDNEIYQYLNDGTPAHIIAARNAPYLVFRQGGFIPKTKPGRLVSRAGRGASGDYRKVKQVLHPGIKARHYDLLIAKRRQKTFEQLVSKELALAARRGAGN